MAERWVVQIAHNAGVYLGPPAPGVELMRTPSSATPPQVRITAEAIAVGPSGDLRFSDGRYTVLHLAHGTWTSVVAAQEGKG